MKNDSHQPASTEGLDSETFAGTTDTASRLTLRLPAIVWTGIAFATGTALGTLGPVSFPHLLFLTFIWLLSGTLLHRWRHHRCALVAVYAAVLCLGITRTQLSLLEGEAGGLRQLAAERAPIATIRGRVDSVPAVHVKPSSVYSPRLFGAQQQTRFRLLATGLLMDSTLQPVQGLCQVYVEGDAESQIAMGDTVEVTGQLDWPKAPGNPGEFHFRKFLERQHVSNLLFVRHPKAISVVRLGNWWNPARWIDVLRKQSAKVLKTFVHEDVRGLAFALLLGDRNQIPTDTERAFVASGTMHLLAISGLHVGILCIFLLRIFNLLLVPRRRSLLLSLAICVIYAMMTDLRPPVVRATLFFAVFVISELLGRPQRIASLIAVTAIVMLAVEPQRILDTGAWLSFLSVSALGWIGMTVKATDADRDTPPDALTITDRIKAACRRGWLWLIFRYRQMLAILALTTPLVADTFHVVSPVGLIVNAMLIPATACVLCFGFITLICGLLLPEAAAIPGSVFSGLLQGLDAVVSGTSEFSAGHLYVADFPEWFVPVYYCLFGVVVVSRVAPIRSFACVGLMLSVIAACFWKADYADVDGIRCTILDVGHGSAAVLELDNGTAILIDAGAMNRGERTSDLVCSYLWNRGYQQLAGIVVSHADRDHYSAVPGVISRIPVAELLTSTQFVDSDSDAVQAVLELAETRNVPVRLLMDGDLCDIAGARLRILQASHVDMSSETADNQSSLVVCIEYHGRCVILPGDLEGPQVMSLIPDLGTADVLASPHHGAVDANSPALGQATRPRTLVVSAREAANAQHLYSVYSDCENVLFTCDSGAVSICVDHSGEISVEEFHADRVSL